MVTCSAWSVMAGTRVIAVVPRLDDRDPLPGVVEIFGHSWGDNLAAERAGAGELWGEALRYE